MQLVLRDEMTVDEARRTPLRALVLDSSGKQLCFDPRIAVNHFLADLEFRTKIDIRKGKWFVCELTQEVVYFVVVPDNAEDLNVWVKKGLQVTYELYKCLTQVNTSLCKRCESLKLAINDTERAEKQELVA